MAANLRAVPTIFPPQPSSPSQQGWVWNGVNWVCDLDCGPSPPPCPSVPCPPPGWPTPCPPWFPPPAGQAPWYPGANGGVSFSATPPANPIRGNLWWDGTVLHLFDGAAWVDIGPQVAGAGGSKGVIDGSVASPGFIGEVIKQSSAGTLSVMDPPAAATTFAALVVPPGDWNIQGSVSISGLTAGVYWDTILFTLTNGTVQVGQFEIFGQFTATAGGLEGGIYSSAVMPLSISATATLQCALSVTSTLTTASGTAQYSFVTMGRRMR